MRATMSDVASSPGARASRTRAVPLMTETRFFRSWLRIPRKLSRNSAVDLRRSSNAFRSVMSTHAATAATTRACSSRTGAAL